MRGRRGGLGPELQQRVATSRPAAATSRSRPRVAAPAVRPVQEEAAQARGHSCVRSAAAAQELLGEEGVPLGARAIASVSAGRQRAWARAASSAELLVVERTEFERQHRTRTAGRLGETPHAASRRRGRRPGMSRAAKRAVRARCGPGTRQVERRDVRPVQVLEHEQQRRPVGAIAERSRASARRTAAVSLPPSRRADQVAGRPQRFDEGLVGQVGSDEVDRTPNQDFEAGRVLGRDLGHEPRLADAGVAGDVAVAPCPPCAASSARSSGRALRVRPTKPCADPGHHPASIAPPPRLVKVSPDGRTSAQR